MIHWTRQIKEVLSAQDAVQTSENAGPLEEIEFWKNRCADLSGITTQLDKPGVKRITSLLQLAKSSYVAPFLKLSSQIKVCSQFYRVSRFSCSEHGFCGLSPSEPQFNRLSPNEPRFGELSSSELGFSELGFIKGRLLGRVLFIALVRCHQSASVFVVL